MVMILYNWWSAPIDVWMYIALNARTHSVGTVAIEHRTTLSWNIMIHPLISSTDDLTKHYDRGGVFFPDVVRCTQAIHGIITASFVLNFLHFISFFFPRAVMKTAIMLFTVRQFLPQL